MARSKKPREKGKVKLSRMFQEIKPGDKVCVDIELSEKANFLGKLQGRTGIVEGKRGKYWMVKIKEIGREKRFIILPIHLKKLK